MVAQHLFKAYDIRGDTRDALTVECVYQIGRALAVMAKDHGHNCLCLGYDGRISSPSLANAMCSALLESGIDVINIGLCTSPMLYFATFHTQTQAGVMITGSHNPTHDNGLKIMLSGEALRGEAIQSLYQSCLNGDTLQGQGQIKRLDISESYLQHIINDIQLARPLRIAIDCGNGAAGVIAETVFRQLGCEVTVLYGKVDGQFPHHHPDPSKPENLTDLIQLVMRQKLDIGLAFDGDADRLGVVNATGNIVESDHVLMVFARDVLSNHPNASVVYDVKCTQHLGKVVKQLGGTPTLWKTGHSHMKAKIKSIQAVLGGELTGHFFFNDFKRGTNTPRWFGFDDGIYAGARLLELLSEQNKTSIWRDLPNTVTTPELHLKLNEGQANLIMQQLQKSASFEGAVDTITIDGLRIEFNDGFGLVRASNTTPVLVFRFEADNVEALKRIQHQFAYNLHQFLPNVDLPF